MEISESTRRRFLRAGGVAFIWSIVPQLGCDSNNVDFRGMPTAPPMEPDMGEPGSTLPAPPITGNDRFYLQSINGQNYDPKLKAPNWSMAIDGLVENPITGITYDDILRMPLQRQVMTMQCIGNWIGGPLVGNAEWGGTRFADVLALAGVRAEATQVKFTSIDGYTTSIPVERAIRDNVLLAWEMNGDQLPSKHGYPVRLINPGHYGQKMPKWITRIELIDDDYLGYWESKPEGRPFKWSNAATATVNSRVDAPVSIWDDVKDPGNGGVTVTLQNIKSTTGEPFIVHGIAMAGERTVERVEVSTDGGTSWKDALITTQSLPNVWVTWAYEWELPIGGNFEVVARATDSAGDTQPMTDAGEDLYDGRTGWHRVPVTVNKNG
ncbi:MAG: molybdopterin-dependent oxidoreductase [Gemmatimonadetes bacterium]|jgi:DMSO/TMAO reductase YedYZ molybdopterin-dependent catalytic subunit|nr:molybdopterin-dependent oxidoreductase [Gemmatimonadota bacterium]MBT6144190.1 molybdopterin-dependent oxidoreductase [Gemmatimonadota bacterium]MBT7862819.1 molybdopterin-dependent oxidoreductase [Gemmatimonadota bacterium]